MIRIASKKAGRVVIDDPAKPEQPPMDISPDDADALARALHWAADQARKGNTRNQTLFIGSP